MKNAGIIGLILVLIGALLIYSGIKNKNPVDVVKLALNGKDLGQAKPLSSGSTQTASTPINGSPVITV